MSLCWVNTSHRHSFPPRPPSTFIPKALFVVCCQVCFAKPSRLKDASSSELSRFLFAVGCRLKYNLFMISIEIFASLFSLSLFSIKLCLPDCSSACDKSCSFDSLRTFASVSIRVKRIPDRCMSTPASLAIRTFLSLQRFRRSFYDSSNYLNLLNFPSICIAACWRRNLSSSSSWLESSEENNEASLIAKYRL